MFLLQITNSSAEVAGQVASGAPEPITLFELLMKGGFVMIPILILFFFTILLIVERLLTVISATRIDKPGLAMLKEHLRNGEIFHAKNISSRSPNRIFRIYDAALRQLGKPSAEIEKAVELTANIELAHMTTRLGYLGLIAGIAPMLGFIGTISGIIRIFYDISITNDLSIGVIAGGLYEKMISSGAGLVVGILAYCGYHYINMLIDKFSARVEREYLDFYNIIESPAYEAA